MSFLSVWLELLNVEVLTSTRSLGLISTRLTWLEKRQGSCSLPFGWIQLFFGVDSFNWPALYGHRFLLNPTFSVLPYYSSFAYGSRYRTLLKAVDSSELGARSFLQVLNTTYGGVMSSFGKPASLPCRQPALLLLFFCIFQSKSTVGPSYHWAWGRNTT